MPNALLNHIRSLQADWDGLGASAPVPVAIDHAERILFAMKDWPLPNRVYAFSSGEIIIEWDKGSSHFEIEVGPSQASWTYSRPDQRTMHGNSIDSAPRIFVFETTSES